MRFTPTTADQAILLAIVEADFLAKFWNRIDRSGGPEACWPWQRARIRSGYGELRIHGHTVYAHRVALAIETGHLKSQVMHACDNPPCCNPACLSWGDDASNSADKVAKNRQPHGERHYAATFTEAEVVSIKILIRSGKSPAAIAASLGVPEQTIYNIRAGRSWKHILL